MLGAFPVKWLITSLVVAVIGVFAWVTLQDMRELDPRAEVTRAGVVAYGHVVFSPRPHIVIDEIWKRSDPSESVAIGAAIPLPVADSSFDRALICFTPRIFSRRLSPSAVFAVRDAGVGLPPVPLSDLKALCTGTPNT
jgi:hypothetical protein